MKRISKTKKVIGAIVALSAAGGMYLAQPAYQRSLYQHWIDADGDCQDTRQEVLIRDADGELTMSDDTCMVLRGLWVDPYSNEIFTNPKDLDVDHMVPLKNAHESGGYGWDKNTRRSYANDLDDPNHLLAVKASENRKKSAKSPDKYLPPYEPYQCEYVDNWVSIKKRWMLSMTELEENAIVEVLKKCEK